jgi:GDP-L-fucose synthase
MRVLITGGCGFVGRHMVRHHLGAGDDVTVVDNLIDGGGGVVPHPDAGAEWHPMDCRQFFELSKLQFDLVHHLAAVVGGRQTIDGHPLSVADDLSIDAAFFQWCARTQPRRVIYYSSSAVYPVHLQTAMSGILLAEEFVSLSDDHFGMPDMSYGWAKLTGEYLAGLLQERHGVPVTIYRPFSGYGEDQGLDYPMPAICQRALLLRDDEQMSVWGDGTQMRDWVHIDDIVWWVAATRDLGGVINLGCGIGVSMSELALMAMMAAGRDVRRGVVGTPGTPVGVARRVSDPTVLRSLGITKTVDLRDGVERVVSHLRSRL